VVNVARAQRFYQSITEATNLAIAFGNVPAANSEAATLPLGTPMLSGTTAPVMAFTAGGFKWALQATAPVAVSLPALALTPTSRVASKGMVAITDVATATSTFLTMLVGTTTTGLITISSDF
jgi:hypothetical protein